MLAGLKSPEGLLTWLMGSTHRVSDSEGPWSGAHEFAFLMSSQVVQQPQEPHFENVLLGWILAVIRKTRFFITTFWMLYVKTMVQIITYYLKSFKNALFLMGHLCWFFLSYFALLRRLIYQTYFQTYDNKTKGLLLIFTVILDRP